MPIYPIPSLSHPWQGRGHACGWRRRGRLELEHFGNPLEPLLHLAHRLAHRQCLCLIVLLFSLRHLEQLVDGLGAEDGGEALDRADELLHLVGHRHARLDERVRRDDLAQPAGRLLDEGDEARHHLLHCVQLWRAGDLAELLEEAVDRRARRDEARLLHQAVERAARRVRVALARERLLGRGEHVRQLAERSHSRGHLVADALEHAHQLVDHPNDPLHGAEARRDVVDRRRELLHRALDGGHREAARVRGGAAEHLGRVIGELLEGVHHLLELLLHRFQVDRAAELARELAELGTDVVESALHGFLHVIDLLHQARRVEHGFELGGLLSRFLLGSLLCLLRCFLGGLLRLLRLLLRAFLGLRR
mmetsp:Transcript_7947/g.20384  ORF Transcript_7947/g.20384 Transcript_7947/m.20384 type:complete len:363 (-) Transcript_7947:245-1333(-)